jgi:hypothetical protein
MGQLPDGIGVAVLDRGAQALEERFDVLREDAHQLGCVLGTE